MKELVLIMNEIMVVKFDLFSGYVINNWITISYENPVKKVEYARIQRLTIFNPLLSLIPLFFASLQPKTKY